MSSSTTLNITIVELVGEVVGKPADVFDRDEEWADLRGRLILTGDGVSGLAGVSRQVWVVSPVSLRLMLSISAQ
jgi:hypothetical protein